MKSAQRRRVLQAAAAAAGAMLLPFRAAWAQPARGFRVGDRYRYRSMDPYSGAEQRTYTIEVTQVTDSEVLCADGRVLDPRGFPRRLPDGRRITLLQAPAADIGPGGRWRAEFLITTANGDEIRAEMDGSVLARERITVPAGSFEALRIEGAGLAHAPLGTVRTRLLVYRAPELVRMPLFREEIRRSVHGRVFFAERDVLVDYRQS